MTKKQLNKLKNRVSELEREVRNLSLCRSPAYMGLHTTDPLTGGSEVSGTGHSRQYVTFGAMSDEIRVLADKPFGTTARPTAPERPPLPTSSEWLEEDGECGGMDSMCMTSYIGSPCLRRRGHDDWHTCVDHLIPGWKGRWYDDGPFVEAV